jgi:hypothetical protein
VEDVAVLCSRFAVIRDGRLVAQTTPSQARSALADTIFEGTADAAELESLRRERCVTQAILVEGKNRVRVHETSGKPPSGFIPVQPTLEDAYLVMMRKASMEN